METGYLNKYFTGVANKKLSDVEINPNKSNQHEFNGTKQIREMLGTESGRREFDCIFLYVDDDETISSSGKMTWYDSRENDSVRTEWRFYFVTTEVSMRAKKGDSLFICRRTNGDLLVLIASEISTIESQIYWLFGMKHSQTDSFISKIEFDFGDDKTELAARMILEQIGIEYKDTSVDNYLEEMVDRFQEKLPTTREFSEYARNTVDDVDPIGDPDTTLLLWSNREEALFKLFEQYLIKERLKEGFVGSNGEVDVDAFIQYSLSVQNTRKSRAGYSFENHLDELLNLHGIKHTRSRVTEGSTKPDFIFPCIKAYHDMDYPVIQLTMLGLKHTCKERWKQVLSEADRINEKHLLTMEASMSESQTNEMQLKKVQLVVPAPLFETYTDAQQGWLYSVKSFFDLVKEKQKFYEKNKL